MKKDFSEPLEVDPKNETPSTPKTPTSSLSSIDKSREELIVKMFNLYQEFKTLEKVAQEFGYTRERIRQYLVLGNKLGIIDYKPFNSENFKNLCKDVSKERLTEWLNQYGAVRRISEKTNISIAHLNRLIKMYDMDVSRLRKNFLKQEILKEYNHLVKNLGGTHPSTYDLLSIRNGRNLWAKISRNWGNFKVFREEQNIYLQKKTRKRSSDNDQKSSYQSMSSPYSNN
jgi:hypothetical protein